MVPDRQPLNILFILFALISLIDLTLQAPLTGNAPQQIDQCPGNGIYGYLNGTQVRKRDDYIHLEMEDLNLEECIKQCYGNHFCYSIYYDETIKNRCVFYYYAGYNCTGKTLVPTPSLKYEGKPMTLDCIRCPGKGDILSTTYQTIVGNINIGNSVNGISINDDKINSIEKANIIQQSPNTGDSSSSNGNINETLNSSDDSSCVLEFIPNFEDVGDEVDELFTNTINDVKDEKECAKLCHNSKCDYAMYKPSTKICSYISDYFGFIKNCSSKPLQNFVLGVMDNKTIETIQIECIRCRQNHIEDVKNINDNKINYSSSKNNEGEWQSMTVDPGDAVTWPTNLQLSGHCVVVFQVDEDEERISKLEFSNETQLQTVEQCAAHCYKSSCSNAVFQFLEHGKGICKISTNTSDICSGNHQHHYRFYTTKTVRIQCIRCLAKKPTTQSPNSLLPGFMDLSSTTAAPPTEESSITPEQQYESNEGGKSETKMLTSPDGKIDKGGEVKEDDEEHTDLSLKTARPPSSAPVDEEEVRSGVTSTTPKVNSNEESESSPTKDISTTESTTTKDITTTEGFTTTVTPSLTTIETPAVSKVATKVKNGNEDPYLRSCVVAFQVKPFSLEDEPKLNEPLMEYEFLTDSVSICATKCYNNGCTGAIYNAETNKCVLQLGKVLKCIGGDTYNNYFPEKNEKIRLFCISCTPDNFKGNEGQIKSNKNGSESTTIVSKIDTGTVGSESDENNVKTSPVVKPGSVFEALTTTPKDENEESTTTGSKKDDESLGKSTSDQSTETTTLISEIENTNKITTSSDGIIKSESTTGPSSDDHITTPEKSQDINVNQKTSLPSSESKESETSKVTTKSPETEEIESSITTIIPEISEENRLSTSFSKSDKESEKTTINTDVEGSGISSDRFEGEVKTTSNSHSEDEPTTMITEGSTAVPDVKKEEAGTTSSPESGKQDKVTTLLTGEDNKATTPSAEGKKVGTEITSFSETDKNGETTTDGTVTDNEKMETTALPESEKEEKVTTILSGEDNQATVPTSIDKNNGMETTISLENEKNQSTTTEGDENEATTILPEGEGKGIEITTVSKIENDGSGDVTVGQEGKEKLETTTNIQEFEQETTVKASSEREKTIETATSTPELGLEISKDITPKQPEKSSESETIEPTSIKPEGIEKMFESSTAPPEEKIESGDSENDTPVATTLLIPVEFETSTAKGLEIGKDNENGPTVKPVGESKSTTIEPEEGSGVEEIGGKASTIIDIKDNPSEQDINLGEERKSTVIPIIDSSQNTENLFPEEKPSSTVSPNNIDSTTVYSVNGESLSPDEKVKDKETTTTSTDLEEAKLETVPLTDDKGGEDTETTNPSTTNGESFSPEENVEEKEPTTMSPEIEETKLETVPLAGDKSEEDTETTTASPADKGSLSPDEIEENKASTTISPSDGQESSSSVSKTEGKEDVTTISPNSEQAKLETISPNDEKAGQGPESTTVSSANKEPLSTDEREPTTISPLVGQESSSFAPKAEDKEDIATSSPEVEQTKLETVPSIGDNTQATLELVNPETTTFSSPEMGLEISNDRALQSIPVKDHNKSVTESVIETSIKANEVTSIKPEDDNNNLTTIFPRSEGDTKKQSTGSVEPENTTGVSEFENGDVDEKVIPDNQKKRTTNIPSLRSENQNIESSFAPENSKEADINKNLPEEAKESEVSATTTEKTTGNIDTVTSIPETENEASTSAGILDSKEGGNEITIIAQERVEDKEELTTISSNVDKQPFAASTTPESVKEPENAATIASELDKGGKATPTVFDKENKSLATTIEPEVKAEFFDFESESKKLSTTISNKESDPTTVATKFETPKEGVVGEKEIDLTTVTPKSDATDEGTITGKESDLTTVVPKSNITHEGEENRKKSDESTTTHLESKKEEGSFVTTESPEKNTSEFESTQTEGSGETLENESGEPTVSSTNKEDGESSTIAPGAEKEVTNTQKILSEGETIEPSTISTGSEFIATTPWNVEETTLSSNLDKDEKSELESTTLSGKDNKEEQKSTTEFTSIDFENQGKPLEGSVFGEKEIALKTTITPETEKENGSSDKNTTPIPKDVEESDTEKPSTGSDTNQNGPSHSETTQSSKDVEKSNNKKVTKEGDDKDSNESSGEEIVDNQEFSSNNTNGLPEMGLEISRFKGLSAETSNKIESSTNLPKTSHNEDESSSITISTEAITKENESTSAIDSEKKEDGTTIRLIESTEPSSSTESSIDNSKTAIKFEKVQEESEEQESTTKIMSPEPPTTILPESEGSGMEDETKGTKIESTTEKITHDSKKTEELFPDDEQIEKLHAQSSTTKLASKQPSTTTEPSNGPAFVTEDEKESENRGTPTSIIFETTVKNDFNVDLTTITSTIDKINDKQTTIQSTESLITTTAIPIDEQLFTVQPFKGLDVQSSKKNQSANDFTTIPGEIKEGGQGSNLSSTTSTRQTGNIEKVISVLETTEKPEVKDNEEVEGSTISSIKNSSEGSRDEKLSSTTVSTIESSTKSDGSSITTVGLEESKNEGDGKESTIESRIVSDGSENDDHTTVVSIETKGEESDKENSSVTTIPKVIDGENESTTIKGSEQEDSKVTTETKSKPESVDFEFSEKTSEASSGNIELTTIGTLEIEGHNEKVTIEGSGEEAETTTLRDQKNDEKVTRPETEEEEIFTTLLPATKMTIIEGENKTNTLSPLAGDLEVTKTNNAKEVSAINNVNATSLEKPPSEGDNVNVIITASTVKTLLNETTSGEENGESPNEESFKQDNFQTTITSSSTTTQNPTEVKIQTINTKNDAEGPAFVTGEPEVIETIQGQTSTATETPDQLTTQPVESPKSDGNKFEELIPEEKKKEEELDASKIDFGPTTTIGNSQVDGQATTIEPVKGFEEFLQTTTSTIITEDDGSIIDTSILKKGKIDTTNPKETDVTLITGDSVATTIDIKDEGNIEESTVKTNLESNEEPTTAKESLVTESPNKGVTTIVSEKDEESDGESNRDSNSHDGFIIEKVETTTLKGKTKEITGVDTTTVSEEIMGKVTFKQDNEDEILSSGIQTTIQSKDKEIEFSAKENTKPPKEETTITPVSVPEETLLREKEKGKSHKVTEKLFETKSTVKSNEPETESGQTGISPDNLTSQKSSEDETTEGKMDVEVTTVKSITDIIEGSTDFNGESTDIQSTHIPIIHHETSTTSESLTTEVTFAVTKEQGTAESIDSATIDKHIDLPKTVGKVDSPISIGEKTAKEDDSEEKSTGKEDYEDKVFVEDIDSKSHGKDKVHTTTEPPVAAVADLVHTLSRTNDLDLLLRGASKQLVDIRKNAKCGLNTLRFAARAMKDFSQEYEVIESVPSLYACLEACYVAGCKKAAFVPYPQPKCLMHYELGSTLTNSCTSSSIYQLTTHWHFSNPSEVIEILCLVCDNDNENSKEKLQIENVFNLLVDDTRKGMEQQAYMTEVCNGAGRLEFQVKPVSKYPRLNITHDVPANSPAECAMKCKENGHCDLAGFVPSPHAKSSGLCLLTSDTHYCDYEDETYKHVSQHQSEVPFLLHCIRCSKCRYNLIPVVPGITEVIPFETTETANNIEECALQCSERKCTTAQFNPKSLTCSTTINPSFKSTCPTEKAIQVDGNLQIRLHCVSCTN